MNKLENLRTNLDDIDEKLITLLAERFRITHEVGLLKRNLNLSPQDAGREKAQFARIEQLATENGLSTELARVLWRQIIDQVIENHKQLRQEQKI
jgi:chorismate mutase